MATVEGADTVETRQTYLQNTAIVVATLVQGDGTLGGELWGNFPQTYSMAGLVISAMRLSKTWDEAFWRGV